MPLSRTSGPWTTPASPPGDSEVLTSWLVLCCPEDLSSCIYSCSGETVKWLLSPASGQCCLEQGWVEETPTVLSGPLPLPHPFLSYGLRITLFTCRQQLSCLYYETLNLSVSKAHTYQENISPIAFSSRFWLLVPQGVLLAESFLPIHTRRNIPPGSCTHRGFSLRCKKAWGTHSAQQTGGY